MTIDRATPGSTRSDGSSFDPSGLTVYADGEYVDGADATVSLWDHGFLYGDGIFEGMRLFDGSLFRPRDHLARLERSARSIGLELPLGEEELLDVICEVIVRSGLTDAHVRPIVTRGFGTPGVDPARCERSSLFVAAYPFPPLLGSDPIRVLVSSVVRKSPRSVGAHVKSLNYLDAVLAKRQATAAGMHEAIMLDHLGAVAECSAANLFLEKGQNYKNHPSLPEKGAESKLKVPVALALNAVELSHLPCMRQPVQPR